MKTKIILAIGAAALVTLSFTFVNVNKPASLETKSNITASSPGPVGGLFADEVIE
jgi:hypothetical protein